MKQNIALIITAFYNYDQNVRINHLETVLKKKGYSVFILSSNFDHRNKKEYTNSKDNLKLLEVPFYSRNMSYGRIHSHYVFSKKMIKAIEEYDPDLIYAITPPNFMNQALSKYKEKNPKVQLITEIEDLWPESMPIGASLKKLASPAFKIWARIRNKNLKNSDVVVFECELFLNTLKKYVSKSAIVHLCKKDIDPSFKLEPVLNEKHFVYLGSVNHLLDIEFICDFFKKSNAYQPSILHIIGGGEKMDELMDQCKQNNIPVINHGMIYDDNKKGDILSKCHYALNVMKPTVFVGITMKSVDYFCYGLPLINTIQGDTSSIVEQYGCGYNVDHNNMDQQIQNMHACSYNEWKNQAKQSRKVYEELFSYDAIEKELDQIIQ